MWANGPASPPFFLASPRPRRLQLQCLFAHLPPACFLTSPPTHSAYSTCFLPLRAVPVCLRLPSFPHLPSPFAPFPPARQPGGAQRATATPGKDNNRGGRDGGRNGTVFVVRLMIARMGSLKKSFEKLASPQTRSESRSRATVRFPL
jgi:hypothetical protein